MKKLFVTLVVVVSSMALATSFGCGIGEVDSSLSQISQAAKGGNKPQCKQDADCDDGIFCNGLENCEGRKCRAGVDPCLGLDCDEASQTCDEEEPPPECDDGLWCNGAEINDALLGCLPGTAPNCDDADPSTADYCDEAADVCVHESSSGNCQTQADCDDGLWCNGSETCDVVFGCQPGTSLNCSDGIACTDDVCDEASDSCSNYVNHDNCQDALFCNGMEVCDSVLDCRPSQVPICSDQLPCTDDSCNEVTDTCIHVDNCPSGQMCSDVGSCL